MFKKKPRNIRSDFLKHCFDIYKEKEQVNLKADKYQKFSYYTLVKLKRGKLNYTNLLHLNSL